MAVSSLSSICEGSGQVVGQFYANANLGQDQRVDLWRQNLADGDRVRVSTANTHTLCVPKTSCRGLEKPLMMASRQQQMLQMGRKGKKVLLQN